MKRKSRLICAMFLPMCLALPVLAGGDAEHHGYNWELFTPWLVNATIFFGGLAYILKKPVVEFFSNRRKDIETSLARAEESQISAAHALEDIERQSKDLESEVAEILAQAKADAATEKERLISLAEQEAEKIGRQAEREMENMKRSALGELRLFLTDLAVKEAEKVISETMTENERKKLFVDFSARLGAKS